MDIKVDTHTVVCFDLDDTLYNEIDFLKSAFKAIAMQLDTNQPDVLYAYMFSLHRSGSDAFDMVSKHYAITKEELIHCYRSHKPSVVPFDNVLSVFQTINHKKGVVGIITDGRSLAQRNKLNALGLMPYIDTILISEETGYTKPHKHNFNLIEEKYNRKNYYYIADNPSKDFVTPNTLGWETIGLIDNGLNIHNNIHIYSNNPEFMPQNLIHSYEALRII
ncbi:HAD family hydrolase [Leptobacterium sp. I13]|uniref:HAD family hydrolase n=1 Tax=Leptobacterium meishanense TaxID=3128904 RepID=UPI0030EBAF1E